MEKSKMMLNTFRFFALKPRITILIAAILLSLSGHCQTADGSDCYNYLRTNLRNTSSGSGPEIFIIGTFHFKRAYTLKPVQQQVVNFKPEIYCVEEVSPLEPYKEEYKNNLYSRYYGADFYSKMLDSLELFTGINSDKASQSLKIQKEKVRENPSDLSARAELANLFFLTKAEANGHLQIAYIDSLAKNDTIAFNIKSKISPYHQKYNFTLLETKRLSIPLSVTLGLEELDQIDIQQNRSLGDSLLSISQRKLIPRLMLKFWKIPKLLRFMKMERKAPENNEEALLYLKKLNDPKTILLMAKLYERYFMKKNVPESVAWNALWIERNRQMVEKLSEGLTKTTAKRAVVLVGASHVPYFIWLIRQQYPDAKIHLLTL